MTNNFSKIKELLDFDNENTFYFIQILQRRKENPNMKSGVRIIDNFYLYSVEDLDKLKDKIIETCEKYNARAYINVNKLNLERIALFAMKKTASLIIEKQYKALKNVYASVCGSHTSENSKRWVIDIDTDELKYKSVIVDFINHLHSQNKKTEYKIIAEIPSKTGLHIISNPFNLKFFNDKMQELGIKINVHKNNPTILYCL
jgi:hypothetical protein